MPQMKDKEARELISTNIAANMLGLGFAATPSGLKAMKRLKLLSDEDGYFFSFKHSWSNNNSYIRNCN